MSRLQDLDIEFYFVDYNLLNNLPIPVACLPPHEVTTLKVTIFRLCSTSTLSQISPIMATPTLATVGVFSIGEMGLGVAKLLITHNYRVVTNITGRRYNMIGFPYSKFRD